MSSFCLRLQPTVANKSKRKGTDWEVALRDSLRDIFPNIERAPSWGPVDKGDLVNTGDFCIEAKASSGLISQGVTEANTEADNAGKLWPVCIAKKARKPVDDAYVVMDLRNWKCLVQYIQDIQERLNGRTDTANG